MKIKMPIVATMTEMSIIALFNGKSISGQNNVNPVAVTNPALDALIPSKEAFITLFCLSFDQMGTRKKIRIVPGKNIPMAPIIPPIIIPVRPNVSMDKAPTYELKEKSGPGKVFCKANPVSSSSLVNNCLNSGRL